VPSCDEVSDACDQTIPGYVCRVRRGVAPARVLAVIEEIKSVCAPSAGSFAGTDPKIQSDGSVDVHVRFREESTASLATVRSKCPTCGEVTPHKAVPIELGQVMVCGVCEHRWLWGGDNDSAEDHQRE